jgi:hypothetical protein
VNDSATGEYGVNGRHTLAEALEQVAHVEGWMSPD